MWFIELKWYIKIYIDFIEQELSFKDFPKHLILWYMSKKSPRDHYHYSLKTKKNTEPDENKLELVNEDLLRTLKFFLEISTSFCLSSYLKQ